jgi:hypothetical protein
MSKIKKFLVISAFLPFIGLAQGLSPSEELEILMSPQNPRPNETVYLRVTSNSTELNNSLISWSRNGVVEKKGVGEKSYEITAPKPGNSITITVTSTRNGNISSNSVVIRPASVSLIWEADSYTPKFYKGKGLAVHQSNIRVIAMPSLVNSPGNKLNSKNLIYEWSLNGFVDKNQSGVGKDIFKFKGSLISKSKLVTLSVASEGGSLSAQENITIRFGEPEILIYKKNPLTGTKNNHSLINVVVEGIESTFIAEPYFFSKQLFDSGYLRYKWTVDGNSVDSLDGSRKITFSSDIWGRSSVSVEISNPINLLERARRMFNVVVNR